MITGDHVVTASAIAKELGILNDPSEALSGSELHQLSDEELDARVKASLSMLGNARRQDPDRQILATYGSSRSDDWGWCE